MVKGLYTAYTGMLNQQNKMDVIANNLANAATVGYKKEGSTSQAFDSVLAYKIKDETTATRANGIGTAELGVKIGENYTDWSQGAFETTDGTFDLALSGNGFFCVEFTNKLGETTTKYTRDGSFQLNVDGYLMTDDGNYVLDVNGNHIQLDTMASTTIDTQGYIYQEGEIVAQLGLADFEDYNYLEHYGENFYQPVDGATLIESSAEVYQGYLEASNVQVVSEMVEMISVTRTYDSNSTVIKTIDETLNTAVNQLGKV